MFFPYLLSHVYTMYVSRSQCIELYKRPTIIVFSVQYIFRIFIYFLLFPCLISSFFRSVAIVYYFWYIHFQPVFVLYGLISMYIHKTAQATIFGGGACSLFDFRYSFICNINIGKNKKRRD